MKGINVRQIPAGRPGAGTKVMGPGDGNIRLHYSADPTMTPEKVASLKDQYPDQSLWDREMEIDDSARAGTRVFPQFDEDIHIVEPFAVSQEEYFTTYLGADPHTRTAHAFVWLSIDKEGDMVVPWSWWPQERNEREGLTVKDYVDGLRDCFKTHFAPEPYRMVMDQAGASMNEARSKSVSKTPDRAGEK